MIPLYEPRGEQIEALYELKKCREECLDKGLVVAATGIGKTYLAALDSQGFHKVLFVTSFIRKLEGVYKSYQNAKNILIAFIDFLRWREFSPLINK
ncbi:DEAD/DEAH box helicase family protein [Clostridium sp. FP1]|uniref:DEAD/DEAH box helicase family protein n=1 Tax=Clostridium sp. FP1 TaxID=2724076 RepID=UPI00398CAABA